MNCLNPTYIKSPESRLLRKCLKEERSFEYYYKHANARRNLLLDPVAIVNSPAEYYALRCEDVRVPERVQKVPCGKCGNCLKRKVNDAFIRNYYEWLDCRVDGTTYFLTLTFANELLPHLLDGTPCFDSEYIKRFLKRLRVYFDRHLDYRGDWKYQIVSEYGGEFGRPHHHALFHLHGWPNTIANTFILKEAVAKCWTKIDDRHPWHANDEVDLFDMQRVDVQPIDTTKSIRYVAKYLGKQDGATQFDERKDVDYRWRRNHWQSIGLGECMFKYMSPQDFENGLITLDGFKYAIPHYFDKLKREFYCYSDDGQIIYQPTAYARDSAHTFTMSKLEEYKRLSLLNEGFPIADPILYDPVALSILDEYLRTYEGFKIQHDFSVLDPALNDDVERVVYAVNDFFERVDKWYEPKYAAQANLYIQHQQERYLKKMHMK